MTAEEGQQFFGDPNRETGPGVGEFLGARPLPGGETGAPERARVLLADDDKNMRFYIRQLLKAHYDVQVVADGAAALAAARTERPDLVLADVLMPGMDGIALLHALRADPDLRTIPVILISGRTEEDARAEGLEQGADDYIIKPFSTRELLARIGTQLEMIRIRRGSTHEIERLLDENRRQRELLQRLFDHATDAILLADPTGPGTVRAANPAACRMFGYNADEFVGLERAAMFSPGEQNLAALLADRETAGQAAAVLRYQRKDGSEFLGEMTTALFSGSDGRSNSVAIIRDVTERMQVEEALRESEARYRTLFESMGEGFVVGKMIYDQDVQACDYQFVQVNAAYERLTGINREESLHKTILQLIPTLEPEWIENHARVVESGEPLRWESANEQTGKTYDIYSYRPGPGLFASIFTDVTERRQVEAERKQQEKQLGDALAQAEEGDRMLAALMEYVPEGITIADAGLNLIRVSRYGQELLGGSHQGKPVAQVTEQWPVWHADGKTPLADEELPLVRAVQHGEVVQDLEVVQANASGERLSLLCMAGPIYDADGQITGAVVAWRDVTARKEAEEALRRYAERLRFLHEVDEAILAAHSMAEVAQAVVDRVPRLLPCRRASAVLYDPQAGQVSLLAAYQDSGHGEPGQVWEGAADVPWDEVLERLAEGQAHEVADVQGLAAGSLRVALLQAEGVRGLLYEPIVVHGQFVGALKLGLDVPGPLDGEHHEVVRELAVQLAIGLEQARLYEEVQRYAGDLERLVEQRTAALIQNERLALMGRLAASLAHEINNPIQAVVGCLGLAIEVLAEGADAGEYLTVAVEELERAARIVHQMRDLGRRDEGLKEPVRVQELVSRVMILTRKQARNCGVQVTWEGPDGLPPLPMVRDQIQQVFLNLVLNAIDAMPQGGALRIGAAPTAEPQGLAVSFADTGMGIPPEDVARLFDAFHSTKELGLGLGLYVSRNIVQAHGGRIDVQSEVGHGATFTVWLPGDGV